MHRSTVLAGVVALAMAGGMSWRADAAENAAGFYLLGAKGSMAGFVPPPGTYLVELNYYYAGDARGQAARGIALRRTGNLTVEADIDVSANAFVAAPAPLWVAPGKVLGGNVGFSVMVPGGWKDVNVDLDVKAMLTLPPPINTTLQAGRQFRIEDSSTALGDPLLNALIGWHEGNWHWTVGALLNVPIGRWEKESISNLSFNHWGLDTTAAVTWLDPARGLELSVATGFTFNWENPDTDYKTGTEFHVEWAVLQHFSKTFALGLAGYHYQQVTGDSGSGASLGPFKGRVTALGPVMTSSFELGKIPVSAELKWLHEFDAENRATGDAGILTISMPLSVPGR